MISDEEAKKLKDKLAELEKEVKRLKKVEKELEDTKKKFEEYKAKHSKTVSELRKALKIKPNNKSLPSFGLAKGHKGYARHIPERIDCIKELDLKRCPYCNARLGKTQEIRSRHITDIVLVSRVRNTRFDLHRKYCPRCHKIVEPEVKDALPHARFGLNLMLLVMYLRLGLRLPCNKIKEYFSDLFNLKISESEVIVILRQLVVAFGDYYSALENIIRFARVKHTDSTSWRINGRNYFAWVFIACGVVLYKIRKRNNSKSPLTVFGTKQKGNTLVIDRFTALRNLAEKAGFSIQFCWSHILADTKELKRIFGAEGRYIHSNLKRIYAMSKGLNHGGTQEMADQLLAEVYQLTLRHYKHIHVRRFIDTLYYKDGHGLFRFVTDPLIDSTNNVSERELRALVIMRKISNGSRSHRGANATAMLLSIIQTLRFKGENVLQGLQAILKNPSGY